MQIVVLVEALGNGQGYRARSGEPLALSVDGSTRAEALQRLQALLGDRLRQGADLVTLSLPGPPLGFAPVWPDDEVTRAWQEGIAEHRRQGDAEPEPWERQAEASS